MLDAAKDSDEPLGVAVADHLSALPAEEILAFEDRFSRLRDAVYRWDVWAAPTSSVGAAPMTGSATSRRVWWRSDASGTNGRLPARTPSPGILPCVPRQPPGRTRPIMRPTKWKDLAHLDAGQVTCWSTWHRWSLMSVLAYALLAVGALHERQRANRAEPGDAWSWCPSAHANSSPCSPPLPGHRSRARAQLVKLAPPTPASRS